MSPSPSTAPCHPQPLTGIPPADRGEPALAVPGGGGGRPIWAGSAGGHQGERRRSSATQALRAGGAAGLEPGAEPGSPPTCSPPQGAVVLHMGLLAAMVTPGWMALARGLLILELFLLSLAWFEGCWPGASPPPGPSTCPEPRCKAPEPGHRAAVRRRQPLHPEVGAGQ